MNLFKRFAVVIIALGSVSVAQGVPMEILPGDFFLGAAAANDLRTPGIYHLRLSGSTGELTEIFAGDPLLGTGNFAFGPDQLLIADPVAGALFELAFDEMLFSTITERGLIDDDLVGLAVLPDGTIVTSAQTNRLESQIGGLFFVDPNTGEQELALDVFDVLEDPDLRFAQIRDVLLHSDGGIYAVTTGILSGPTGGWNPGVLIRLDPITGETTLIDGDGLLPTPDQGGAVNRMVEDFDGTLLVTTGSGEDARIVRVDPVTGSAEVVANLPPDSEGQSFNNIFEIGVTLTGELLVTDTDLAAGSLFLYDLDTGTPTSVNLLGPDIVIDARGLVGFYGEPFIIDPELISVGDENGDENGGEPPVSVPEPGTLALLGLGLAVMGLARRRKKV